MKTKSYNPSQLEIELANIILGFKDEISSRLASNQVQNLTVHHQMDNPNVTIDLIDQDGDSHQMALRIIQKVDQEG